MFRRKIWNLCSVVEWDRDLLQKRVQEGWEPFAASGHYVFFRRRERISNPVPIKGAVYGQGIPPTKAPPKRVGTMNTGPR